MASLKEVKDRIDSVKSTKKITSAMKMIATSKLRRSQSAITSFLPYSTKLNEVLTNLLASDTTIDSPYAEVRELERVAIVAFTSNTSLCGGFNANILKEVSSTVSKYTQKLGKDNVIVYPIGKKIADFAVKSGFNVHQNSEFIAMADKPAFPLVLNLSKELVQKFLKKELDKIILVYTHFQSMGVQVVTNREYLPFDLVTVQSKAQDEQTSAKTEYLLEPSIEGLLSELIPKVLASNLFAALLDSNASENAARSLAMQIATDNADELVQDLTIEYNKNRQAAITNQLLDIIGGASALQ